MLDDFLSYVSIAFYQFYFIDNNINIKNNLQYNLWLVFIKVWVDIPGSDVK